MTHTTHPSTATTAKGSHRAEWALYASYAALLLLACAGPMVPQAVHYHDFADQRAWGGLHNAMDVLSNLPFLVIGLLGCWLAVWRAPKAVQASGARPWLALVFGGLVMTAIGSSYYHLAPSDWRVFWDRMGMVPVFAGVLGLAVESVLQQRAAVVTAALALLGGPIALWVWLQTGQLLPWAVLQGGGMVLLLALAIAQWRKPVAAPRIQWPLAALVAWYALAKVLELGDTAIWAASAHSVAGHGLKHVAAALALVPLLQTVQRLRNAGNAPAAAAGTMPQALVRGGRA